MEKNTEKTLKTRNEYYNKYRLKGAPPVFHFRELQENEYVNIFTVHDLRIMMAVQVHSLADISSIIKYCYSFIVKTIGIFAHV